MIQYVPMNMFERNLPPYLAHDLEAWKKGVEEKSAAEKPTALSYTNSCLSEHIASTIANMIGFKAHETRLGTFTNGRTKIVCACRDFTAEREARIYSFPASALKENGKKIGYVDFFKSHGSDILALSLARIVPRIDFVSINAFIDALPLLTDLQQRFYKTYIAARYTILFDQKGTK